MMKKGKAKRIFAVRIWLLLVLSMTGFKHQINMEKTSMMQAAAMEEVNNKKNSDFDSSSSSESYNNEEIEIEVEVEDDNNDCLKIGRLGDEQLETTRKRLASLKPKDSIYMGQLIPNSIVEYMVKINHQYYEMASQLLKALKYDSSHYKITLETGSHKDKIKFKGVSNIRYAINELEKAYTNYEKTKKENKENDINLNALVNEVSATISTLNENIEKNKDALDNISKVLESINYFNKKIVLPRASTLMLHHMSLQSEMKKLKETAKIVTKNQEDVDSAAADKSKNNQLIKETMEIMNKTLNAVEKLEEEVRNLDVKAAENEKTNKLLAAQTKGVSSLHGDLTKFAENFNKVIQLDASLKQEEEKMRQLLLDVKEVDYITEEKVKQKYKEMDVHELIQEIDTEIRVLLERYDNCLEEIYKLKEELKQNKKPQEENLRTTFTEMLNYIEQNKEPQAENLRTNITKMLKYIDDLEKDNDELKHGYNRFYEYLIEIDNALKEKQEVSKEDIKEGEDLTFCPGKIKNKVIKLKEDYDALAKQKKEGTHGNGMNYNDEDLSKKADKEQKAMKNANEVADKSKIKRKNKSKIKSEIKYDARIIQKLKERSDALVKFNKQKNEQQKKDFDETNMESQEKIVKLKEEKNQLLDEVGKLTQEKTKLDDENKSFKVKCVVKQLFEKFREENNILKTNPVLKKLKVEDTNDIEFEGNKKPKNKIQHNDLTIVGKEKLAHDDIQTQTEFAIVGQENPPETVDNVEELQKKVNELNDKISNLENENANLIQENEKLTIELKTEQYKQQVLQTNFENVKKEKNEYIEKLNMANQEKNKAELEKNKAEIEKSNLKRKNKDFSEQNKKLQGDYDQLVKDHNNLQEEHDQLVKDHNNLQEESKKTKLNYDQLEKASEESQTKIERLENERNQLLVNFNTVKEAKTNLEKENTSLKEKLEGKKLKVELTNDIEFKGKEKPKNEIEQHNDLTIVGKKKPENEKQTQEELTIEGQTKPENKEQTQEELTIEGQKKPENEEQLQEEFEIVGQTKPENEEQTQEEFEIVGQIKPENEEQFQEELTIQGQTKPENEEQTQEELTIEKQTKPENEEQTQEELTIEGQTKPENEEQTQEEFEIVGQEKPENEEQTQEELTIEGQTKPENEEQTQEELTIEGQTKPENEEQTQEEFEIVGQTKPENEELDENVINEAMNENPDIVTEEKNKQLKEIINKFKEKYKKLQIKNEELKKESAFYKRKCNEQKQEFEGQKKPELKESEIKNLEETTSEMLIKGTRKEKPKPENNIKSKEGFSIIGKEKSENEKKKETNFEITSEEINFEGNKNPEKKEHKIERENVEDLKKKVDELTNINANLQKENETTTGLLSDLQEKLNSSNKTLFDLKEKNGDLGKQLEELKKNNVNVSSTAEEIKKLNETNQLQEEVSKLNEIKDNLKKENNELKLKINELNESNKSNENLVKEYKKEASQLDDLKKELEEEKKKSSKASSDLTTVRTENESLKKELEIMKKDPELKNKVENFEAFQEKYTSQIKELQNQLNQALNEVDSLKKQNEENVKVQDEYLDNTTKLNKQLNSYSEKLSNLNKEKKYYESLSGEQKSKLDQNADKIAKYKNEIKELKKKLKEKEEKYDKNPKEIKPALEQNDREINEYKNKIKKLNKKVEDAGKFGLELNRLTLKLKSSEEIVLAKENTILEQEGEITDLKDKIEKLKACLNENNIAIPIEEEPSELKKNKIIEIIQKKEGEKELKVIDKNKGQNETSVTINEKKKLEEQQKNEKELLKENENLRNQNSSLGNKLKKAIDRVEELELLALERNNQLKALESVKAKVEEFGKYERMMTQKYAVLQRTLDTYKFRAEEYVELKRTMVNDGMRLLGLNASRLENASAIGLYRIIVERLDGNARLRREGMLNMRNIGVMPEKELSRFRQEIELNRYTTKNQNKGELNKNMEKMRKNQLPKREISEKNKIPMNNQGTSNLRNPLRYIQDEERRQKREQQVEVLKLTKRIESGNTEKMRQYPKKK